MQNAGYELSMGTMVMWLFIAVIAAIGNAGVPMGLLLPDLVLNVRYRRSYRFDGRYLADLHHYRHD